MNLNVDGILYKIGAYHSGETLHITNIRFNTYIEGEFVFLDDVSATHNTAEDVPDRAREEITAMKEDLTNRLTINIRKLVDARSSNGRTRL